MTTYKKTTSPIRWVKLQYQKCTLRFTRDEAMVAISTLSRQLGGVKIERLKADGTIEVVTAP